VAMKIPGLFKVITLSVMLNLPLSSYTGGLPASDANGGNAACEKSNVKAYLSSRKADVLYAR